MYAHGVDFSFVAEQALQVHLLRGGPGDEAQVSGVGVLLRQAGVRPQACVRVLQERARSRGSPTISGSHALILPTPNNSVDLRLVYFFSWSSSTRTRLMPSCLHTAMYRG
jgi:hypothetical protein